MQKQTNFTFKHGIFGEIIPPPMMAGFNPDEILQEIMGEEYTLPQPKERKEFYPEAAIYAHQQQLANVFAGQTKDIDGGEALYRAAMNGELISLCPLGYEQERYATFVPVFFKLPSGQWQVGLPDYGKSQVINAPDLGKAYLQAREIYATWAEQEVQ